jgi:hypothetical protein
MSEGRSFSIAHPVSVLIVSEVLVVLVTLFFGGMIPCGACFSCFRSDEFGSEMSVFELIPERVLFSVSMSMGLGDD